MAQKTERLLNLLALLLATRRPLTAEQIRAALLEYRDQSDDAFHRMFERDKVDLRNLGFPVEAEDVDGWGVETGYRIAPGRSLLDDPGLTPEEAAALSLAALAWGGDGALGANKLSVGQPASGSGTPGWLFPRITHDETVSTLMAAVERRKRVSFDYRTGGGGEPQRRTLDPHSLYFRGVWYVGGFDHDRGEVRHFRVSRIEGAVSVNGGSEPDFDPPDEPRVEVRQGPWEGEPIAQATIAFAPDVAWWAERRTSAERMREREDGWVELRLPVADLDAFAGWIAGFADRAEALDPAEVRDAVAAHLRAVLEALDAS